MKDHEIAIFINELTKVAKEYGHTQLLRERIVGIVLERRSVFNNDERYKKLRMGALMSDGRPTIKQTICDSNGEFMYHQSLYGESADAEIDKYK